MDFDQPEAFYSIELISVNISSMEQRHHQTEKSCEGELSWGIRPGGAIFAIVKLLFTRITNYYHSHYSLISHTRMKTLSLSLNGPGYLFSASTLQLLKHLLVIREYFDNIKHLSFHHLSWITTDTWSSSWLYSVGYANAGHVNSFLSCSLKC